MKCPVPFLLPLLAAASLLCGCVVSRRLDAPADPLHPTDSGISVDVYSDGSLELYGNPITRRALARRLRSEAFVKVGGERRPRAVILEANPGASRQDLLELRLFLLDSGIPRVNLRMQRTVKFDGSIDQIETARDGYGLLVRVLPDGTPTFYGRPVPESSLAEELLNAADVAADGTMRQRTVVLFGEEGTSDARLTRLRDLLRSGGVREIVIRRAPTLRGAAPVPEGRP